MKWISIALIAICASSGVLVRTMGSRGDVTHHSGPPAVTSVSARRVASGPHLRARLSDNGKWLLVSKSYVNPIVIPGMGGGVGGSGSTLAGLYLVHVDRQQLDVRRGLILVGQGGEAEGVSDDGQTIAYRCGVLTMCIEDVGSHKVRKIELPCPQGDQVKADMAADLRSIVVSCKWTDLPAEPRLVQIKPHSIKTSRIPNGLVPRAVSSDGATVILENESNAIYADHDGRVQQLSGLTHFGSISSDGAVIVASGTQMQTVTCGKGCTLSMPTPIVFNLQTGHRQEVRLTGSFIQESAKWVANDGQALVYSEVHGITSQETLQLVNTNTAAQSQLADAMGGFTEVGMNAEGNVLFYVVKEETRGKEPSRTLYVGTLPARVVR